MPLSPAESHTDITRWETKAHGSHAFPVACYLVELPGHRFKAHWHTELELIQVHSGQVKLYAGTGQFLLTEGMGAFLNTNVLHTVELADRCCRAVLHHTVFHPRLIGGYENSVFWQKYLDPLLTSPLCSVVTLDLGLDLQQKLLSQHEKVWEAIAQDAHGYEFTAREGLSQIILDLADQKEKFFQINFLSPSQKQIKNQARIKDMLLYIHEHYFEDISLEALSFAGNTSKSGCLRCFRESLGTTPLQYVKQYRLQTAANLLKDTDWQISEIASRCGFEEMGYFAAQFRQMYGCTPSEYRRTS
ncbi:MAG: helix-turn-helix transcriptional regulator [Lachnospiraceae bacterium]|nr:helix-turn-helix transcriptional regulator [Lachnospiraceae bacterium]